MEDFDAVSESAVQTEKENDKSSFPDTELPQPPDTNPNQRAEAWKSGLCACCNNPCNGDTLPLSLSLSQTQWLHFELPLVTAVFPCLTFGLVAEMVDEGNICLCCKWKYGLCKQTADYRTKLRNKFNLAEGPALDWVTHFCCHCCALCQEYRELQSRGFHPSLGNFS
ncbi:hypothetical protein Pint_16437 [Pistacia integerrima]|uniref:Uncharacterized protein n=1 Tax=Pistacia integerrima TaxID=434235 RepID=A0ACC0Z992_9ROSI|nr:hypothetical protein Pint_16437 [Pistacia integerrima]